jgi:hypothetical protein
MRMAACLPVAIAFVAIGLSPALATDQVPLPADLTVRPPGRAIPADIAAFSGRWEGRWSHGVDHILVVQRIWPRDAEGRHKVRLVFAWGDSQSHVGTRVLQAPRRSGYRLEDSYIEHGELILLEGGRRTISYRLTEDRTRLEGRWRADRFQKEPSASTFRAGFFSKASAGTPLAPGVERAATSAR